MTPAAHQSALVEHEDLVCMQDAADPLSDDEDRGSAQVVPKILADLSLGTVIKCGEAVVEEEDRWGTDDRACDAKPLPLPSRDVRPSL